MLAEEMSSNGFTFIPKKKRSIAPTPKRISASKAKKFRSMDTGYNYDLIKAQPGEIFMSTVGKIKHPVLEMKLGNRQFILFDKVSSFSYHTNLTGTTGYACNLE